jgi:GTP-binding protein
LGLAFLKHLERTSVVLYVLDGFETPEHGERTPLEALHTLKTELSQYSAEMFSRRSLVVINKIDIMEEAVLEVLVTDIKALGHEVMTISAAQRVGLQALKNRLYEIVIEEREKNPPLFADEFIAKKKPVSPMDRPRGIVIGQTFKIPLRPVAVDNSEGKTDRA